MLLVVRCPECKQTMRYHPRIEHKHEISEKRKKCVYCGRSFKVHSNRFDSNIVRIEE